MCTSRVQMCSCICTSGPGHAFVATSKEIEKHIHSHPATQPHKHTLADKQTHTTKSTFASSYAHLCPLYPKPSSKIQLTLPSSQQPRRDWHPRSHRRIIPPRRRRPAVPCKARTAVTVQSSTHCSRSSRSHPVEQLCRQALGRSVDSWGIPDGDSIRSRRTCCSPHVTRSCCR